MTDPNDLRARIAQLSNERYALLAQLKEIVEASRTHPPCSIGCQKRAAHARDLIEKIEEGSLPMDEARNNKPKPIEKHGASYFVIQWRQNDEAVNIGVVVVCDALGFAEFRLTDQSERVHSAFGTTREWVDRTLHGIPARLRRVMAKGNALSDMKALAKELGNAIQLTPARGAVIHDRDGKLLLNTLYEKFVHDA